MFKKYRCFTYGISFSSLRLRNCMLLLHVRKLRLNDSPKVVYPASGKTEIKYLGQSNFKVNDLYTEPCLPSREI